MSISIYEATIDSALGIIFDKNDNLYVARSGFNDIIKVEPSGPISTFCSGFKSPQNVVFDNIGFPGGNLYVMDEDGIYQVSINGFKTLFATISRNHYLGMVIDSNNNLYYSSNDGDNYGNIYKISTNKLETLFIEGVGTLNSPLGLAIDNDGNFLIANKGEKYISKYDSNGNAINPTFIYEPSSKFINLIVDKNNNIYVSKILNNIVGAYINMTQLALLFQLFILSKMFKLQD